MGKTDIIRLCGAAKRAIEDFPPIGYKRGRKSSCSGWSGFAEFDDNRLNAAELPT